MNSPEHTLKVIRDPVLSNSGFNGVNIENGVASFIFVNEALVRFATTGSHNSGSPTFTTYFFNCDDAAHAAHECDVDINAGLNFFCDERFENIVKTFFLKHFITDENVHEFVFRITANPLKNYPGTFLRVSIALHDVDLERYAHSPTQNESLLGEINNEWNEEELELARELRATIPLLEKPLTRDQFIATYCDKFGRDKKYRAESLWLQKEEVGLYG